MPDMAYQTLGVLLALAGLALLYRSLLHDRSRGRRRCPKCWYDLRASDSLTCPECGYTAKRERQLLKTRRWWRWATISTVVLFAAATLLLWPKVRRDGLWSVTPTTVLVLIVPWIDNTSVISEISGRDGEFWGWQKRWLIVQLERHIEQYPDHVSNIVDLLWYAHDLPEAVRFAFMGIDRPDDEVSGMCLLVLDREEMRREIVNVIGADRVYRRLSHLAGHTNPEIREASLRLLSPSEETGESLFPIDQIAPIFLSALADENIRVRTWAGCLFAYVNPLPSEVVARLSGWISSDDPTAFVAIIILGGSDMPTDEFDGLARKALRSGSELTRKNALRALCGRGDAVLPILRDALNAAVDPAWREWIELAITAVEEHQPVPQFW